MKSRLMGFTAAALLLVISPGAMAIQVFADFDGGMAWDASVDTTPGAALTASIYVAQSDAEVLANGGLESFDLIAEAQGGLTLLGSGADKGSNVVIDPFWDSSASSTWLGGESVRVGGNLFENFPSEDPLVHLFDISLVAPAALGSYPFVLGDAPGLSFNAGFETYDPDNVTFNPTQVNVVPLPAAVWMMGAALLGLVGRLRRRA